MKHYPPSFEIEAVALCPYRPDATIGAVAGDLGVNPEALRNWIRIDDGRRPGSHTTTAHAPAVPGSLEVENTVLRKRVRELEEERDILRRAAKYFAGETRW